MLKIGGHYIQILLLQAIDPTGIRGVHPNRSLALAAFCPFLEREQESLFIVASSFLGVKTVAEERVTTLLRRKVTEVRDFRILMTHPDIGKLREKQEGRSENSISNEIKESVQHCFSGESSIRTSGFIPAPRQY
jgi:hypothetical protein